MTPEAIASQGLHAKLNERDIIDVVDTIFRRSDSPPSAEELTEALETWRQILRVANLIEALGVLVSTNALTSDVVYKMWGGAILSAWSRWDEAVKRLRVYDGEPDTFIHFEEISLKVQEINKQRKQKLPATSEYPAPLEREGAEPGTDALSSQSSFSNSSVSLTWRLGRALAGLFFVALILSAGNSAQISGEAPSPERT